MCSNMQTFSFYSFLLLSLCRTQRKLLCHLKWLHTSFHREKMMFGLEPFRLSPENCLSLRRLVQERQRERATGSSGRQ